MVHDDAGQQAFADLVPLVQKSSDDLRRIAHNLMPPEFARIGLRYALEQLVHSQPPVPTRFTFLVSGHERRLPLDTELNLYRIISEQVQNVNKHAKADRAAVQLLYYDDKLALTVEDDGLGNKTTLSGGSPGIGLKTSKLRAEYIGATLWRDASEVGTLVVLEIAYPLHTHESTQSRPPVTD
jgi:signal transduction histidine kinase